MCGPLSSIAEKHTPDHVLTCAEHQGMLAVLMDSLKPTLLCAQYTGIRKAEIVRLTRDRVDLKTEFIRFKGNDTMGGMADQQRL